MTFNVLNWLSDLSGTNLTNVTLDNQWHYLDKAKKKGYIGRYEANKAIVSYNNFKDPIETKAFFTDKNNPWVPISPTVKPPHHQAPKQPSRQWWYDIKSFPTLSSEPNGVPYFHNKGLADEMNCLDIRYGQWDSRKWLALLIESAIDGEPLGTQRIFEDNSKRFSAGLDKNRVPIICVGYGDMEGNKYYLCEGIATTLTIKAAVGTAICCLDASNMPKVAATIKAKNPRAYFIYCADHDEAGIKYAQLACNQFGGKMVLPIFTKEQQENGLNDFNDLHQVRGLDAVKRCFEVSGLKPHHPDSHWFLDNGAIFSNQYMGRIRDNLSETEYLAEPLGLACNMGSGKTYALIDYSRHNGCVVKQRQFRPEGSPFSQVELIKSGMTVMIIVPTIALAKNAAKKFNATFYSDIKGISTDYRIVVTTIDSITHFGLPEILIIDEVTQCVSALADSNRRINLEKFKYFVKNAKRLIISDANLTPDCFTNQWIEKIREHQTAFVTPSVKRKKDRRGMKVYKYEPYQYKHNGKTIKVQARDSLLQHVRKTHFKTNKRMIIASDSANMAHAIYVSLINPGVTLSEISKWIAKDKKDICMNLKDIGKFKRDKNILLVTKNTIGNEEVKAFLNNPNEEANKYQHIIYSPAMGSGISIENNSFDEICWFANGKPLTAESSLQLPFRYRQPVPIFLAITLNHSDLEKDAEEILNQRITKRVVNSKLIDVIALIRKGRDQEALEKLKDKMNGAPYEVDEIVTEIEAEQNRSKMEFEGRIIKHLEERGFQIVNPDAKKYESARQWLEHSKDLRDFYTLTAEDLTDQERDVLRQAEDEGRPLSELERLQIRKYDIKAFLRLKNLEHQEDILFYDKYRLQINQAKLLSRDFDYWLKQANDKDQDKPDYQRKNLATELIQGLAIFEECGLAIVNRQITYDGNQGEYLTKESKNLLKRYGVLCHSKVVNRQGKSVRVYSINVPWLKMLNFYLLPSQQVKPVDISAYRSYLIGEKKAQEQEEARKEAKVTKKAIFFLYKNTN